jgi:hypothetical protein
VVIVNRRGSVMNDRPCRLPDAGVRQPEIGARP